MKGLRCRTGGKSTYGAESNGGSSQAYETPIPGMGLVDGISKVIAELVQDGFDSGVVLCGNELSDDPL